MPDPANGDRGTPPPGPFPPNGPRARRDPRSRRPDGDLGSRTPPPDPEGLDVTLFHRRTEPVPSGIPVAKPGNDAPPSADAQDVPPPSAPSVAPGGAPQPYPAWGERPPSPRPVSTSAAPGVHTSPPPAPPPRVTPPPPGNTPPPPLRPAPPPARTASLPTRPPGEPPSDTERAGPGEPRERRRGVLVPLLVLATALLLVTSVAMGAMYTTTSSELKRNRDALAVSEGNAAGQTAVVSGKDKTIAELKAAVERVSTQLAATKRALDGTKDQLSGTKDQLGSTKDRLGTTQSQLGATQAQKAVVSRCLKLILQFFNAAARGENDKARKLYQQAAAPCEAADKIVNP